MQVHYGEDVKNYQKMDLNHDRVCCRFTLEALDRDENHFDCTCYCQRLT